MEMDATRFRSEIRIHETAAHGRVLELVLTGVHEHKDTQSAQLLWAVARELKHEISRQQAKAIIINLLSFDYSFGDEIGILFLPNYMFLARSGGGKIAIVASGRTATSLDSLFRDGHLDSVLGFTIRRDLASALAHMTEIPAIQD